jgi:DNA-3-methyladenine glycosylase II
VPGGGRPGAHLAGAVAPPGALAHLRGADPVMAALVDELGEAGIAARLGADERPSEHYGALIRAIVGQQVSTRAARAMWGRLTERFGGRAPLPEEVLAADAEELRAAAGLSRAKVVYLRSLAEHVVDGSLELDRLDALEDAEVVRELVTVKGIGRWSAEIFLIFRLGRPDVLPSGDLGIRRAVQIRYGWEELPAPSEVDRIGEPWRPYRTAAALLLWRSLAATPV